MNETPYVIFYIIAAVFVATSLFGRGLPVGKGVKLALVWVAIFTVAITAAVTIGAYL